MTLIIYLYIMPGIFCAESITVRSGALSQHEINVK